MTIRDRVALHLLFNVTIVVASSIRRLNTSSGRHIFAFSCQTVESTRCLYVLCVYPGHNTVISSRLEQFALI